MINSNGVHVSEDQAVLKVDNRGYAYGDAIFETVRINQGTLLFWEDHYFRMMASMRMLRMQIPMNFTQEFLEQEIQSLIKVNKLKDQVVRAKIIVHRVSGGLYTPDSREVGYTISVKSLEKSPFYTISEAPYEVTLFKDYYIANDLLSTLKSNSKLPNILGGIFAQENGFDNCILLNTNKMVLEATNGNLFLVKDNKIKTPPLSDGCLQGVLRTQLLRILEKFPEYEVEESSVSPFELQKADELFFTNVIVGIQPITKFKKKKYKNQVSKRLLGILNAQIRLGN
ncbi:aminotransferase class IV [Aquimarina intermedia]|uniref:branched-chain-amino-acid transaminase n=1 Tax=Aquimarina intermedia TaxID=350814 RepID=A0A5S5C6X8_9FLAO|nr:aminotransferase class IV [Aquimarina intermedia]TYP75104.1 branched-chain amino acid aminotransferase [Aquimarina intermedia]